MPEPLPEGLRMASLGVLYRRLVQDQGAVVEFAAGALRAALPGAVQVKHRGLLGGGPVERVTVTLGSAVHELRVGRGGLEATRGELVGGVVLRHDVLPVGEWIASLLGCLDRWAGDSDAARAALEQLR